MPPIGMLTGGMDFRNLAFTLKEKTADAPAVTINYGVFINTVIDFVIVAFCIFMLIRGINQLKRKEEAQPAAPSEPPKQEVLLGEIRDLLKARK
jgi:large conductance mechanosensitive channel